MKILVLLATLGLGCGCGAARESPVTDGHVGPDRVDAAHAERASFEAGGCGAIGQPCMALGCGTASCGCPDGLVCYSGGAGGFCAPARPPCAGFAGAACGSATPICLVPDECADCQGACVTPAEQACICARNPGSVADCPDGG